MTKGFHTHADFHVVIAGGGVAALESALALRELAADQMQLTLVCPSPDFVYRPTAVLEPFTGRGPRRLPPAKIAGDRGARFVEDAVVSVDDQLRLVDTGSEAIPYDALVLATGARAAGWLPGAVAADAGTVLRITIVTAEARPLEVFGSGLSETVQTILADAGIATLVEQAAFPSDLDVERVISLPTLGGVPITGVPVDEGGFLTVDATGRLHGLDHAFAVGDCTDFPVRWGGVAAAQADAVAATIAASAGLSVDPSPFDARVHGVLFRGRASRLFFTVRFEDGVVRESASAETPTTLPAAKIAARRLGPYLDALWAAGPRWLADELWLEHMAEQLPGSGQAPVRPSR
jgi:sulfide:quinone oxidoreductase